MSRPLQDYASVKPGNFTRKGEYENFEIRHPIGNEVKKAIIKLADKINTEVLQSAGETLTSKERDILDQVFGDPKKIGTPPPYDPTSLVEEFGGEFTKTTRGSKVEKLPEASRNGTAPVEYYTPNKRFPEGFIYMNKAGFMMTVRNGEHVRLNKNNAPEIIRPFMENVPEEQDKIDAYDEAMTIL